MADGSMYDRFVAPVANLFGQPGVTRGFWGGGANPQVRAPVMDPGEIARPTPAIQAQPKTFTVAPTAPKAAEAPPPAVPTAQKTSAGTTSQGFDEAAARAFAAGLNGVPARALAQGLQFIPAPKVLGPKEIGQRDVISGARQLYGNTMGKLGANATAEQQQQAFEAYIKHLLPVLAPSPQYGIMPQAMGAVEVE